MIITISTGKFSCLYPSCFFYFFFSFVFGSAFFSCGCCSWKIINNYSLTNTRTCLIYYVNCEREKKITENCYKRLLFHSRRRRSAFFKCQSLRTERKLSWISSILYPSAPTNEAHTRNVFFLLSTFFNTMNILLPCSYLKVYFEFSKTEQKSFLMSTRKEDEPWNTKMSLKNMNIEKKKTHFDIPKKKYVVCISAPNDISRIQSNCLFNVCVYETMLKMLTTETVI